MERRSSRGLLRPALVAIAAVLAVLVGAPAAGAHARLITTEPANDAVLPQSPRSVVLHFDEPVETAFGSVRVFDGQAQRVDDRRVVRPDDKTVGAPIDRKLPRGTYTVTWHVVSADSHPISGAFVFHVQAAGSNPAGIANEVLGAGTPASVRVGLKLTRFFDFALLLLVVGGAVALVYPLDAAGSRLRRQLLSVLAAWAALLSLAALAGIVLQAANAGGFGIADALRWDSVSGVLETRFGKVWLVQAILAAALAVLALVARSTQRRGLVVALAACAAALVVTPSLSGHAAVGSGLALTADLAHVAAAAVWTGGLAFVVVALLLAGAERWPLASSAVPRFSRLAVVAVAVLLIAGTISGYEELGAWRGLWDTTYGLLLVAKILLVLPLLALGLYNNRISVPKLRDKVASPLERRRFLRVAGAELAIVVAVVAVTSVLVTEPPAKASIAPSGPYATTVPLGNLEAKVVADPAEAGLNVIDLHLSNASGQPADVAELELNATLPSASIGPLRFEAHRLAPGHYAVHDAQLAVAGDWQVAIQARRGEFESLNATVSIPIRERN